MRVGAGTAVLSASCLLAGGLLGGCGASESAQVQAKVEQFVRAASIKDYATICNKVLAPPLLEHLSAGGISCEQAMAIALASVQQPSLSIGRIVVKGSRASVITLTMARGQQASLDAIELVKTAGGWRIASLGSPVVPGAGAGGGSGQGSGGGSGQGSGGGSGK
jgi:hypothetical protein